MKRTTYWKIGRICGLAVVGIILLEVMPANAVSAVQGVETYKNIDVKFTKNARKCDFQSLGPFERYLTNSLRKVGLRKTRSSIVTVSLEIGGIPFGAFETQCAVEATLHFRTMLRSDNIVTDSLAVRETVNRLQVFPISLYSVGAFGVDTTLYTFADGRNITKAEKKVLDMIDRLVMRFDKARGN